MLPSLASPPRGPSGVGFARTSPADTYSYLPPATRTANKSSQIKPPATTPIVTQATTTTAAAVETQARTSAHGQRNSPIVALALALPSFRPSLISSLSRRPHLRILLRPRSARFHPPTPYTPFLRPVRCWPVMASDRRARPWTRVLSLALVLVLLCGAAHASVGDRLPEFKQCLEASPLSRPPWLGVRSPANVRRSMQVCKAENCGPSKDHTPIRTSSSLSSPPSIPARAYPSKMAVWSCCRCHCRCWTHAGHYANRDCTT